MNISLPQIESNVVRRIAEKRGVSCAAAVRIAIGFLQAADKAAAEGFEVGGTKERDILDFVLTPRTSA